MFLNKFKSSPKNKNVLIITIAGLLVVILVYLLIFIPIEAAVPTYGILDFEFAWTPDQVLTIFSAWGPDGIRIQTLAIYWDFLYIVGYVSLALGLILIVLRRSEGKLQTIGLYFTLLPFLTGIFDIVENINLLLMLNNPISLSTINSLTASMSALIKFGCLLAAIIYFVIALIIIILKKIRK
jgi:hypothetical protein